ncbi:hypothetical protein RFF05_06175 [Bengtsoniella intestinalis]|uniref:hypothetical protein n=1 Tax=Bengtsoniella intestinalis TaxID=3073143 RepID=UPI00391F8928
MYQSMQPTQHWSAEVRSSTHLAPVQGEFELDTIPGTMGATQATIPATQPPQMHHNLPSEVVTSPITADETYTGSLKAMLLKNVGHYVVVTFLVGTQNPVSWEGYLHSVGNDYLVIYQPDKGRYVSGDYYALKFVEFYDKQQTASGNVGYRRRDGQQMW